MKKIVLIIMAVMAFAGMSVAQDIYSTGYYTDGSRKIAAVYNNNTKLYEHSHADYSYVGTDVLVHGGDVYWSVNRTTLSNSRNTWAGVRKNGSFYLNLDSDDDGDLKINDICDFPSYSTIYAVGCKRVDGVKTAVMWAGTNTTPSRVWGNGTQQSEALCCFPFEDYIYGGGYQYNSSGDYAGKVWKGNNVIYSKDDVYIRGIYVYEGNVYYVGTYDGATSTVWRNDAVICSFSGVGRSLWVDAGDVYVAGSSSFSDNDVKVWKNGTLIHSQTGSGCFTVLANTEGVYYGGKNSGGGKIWKNNSQILAPYPNACINGIYVEDIECEEDIFTLPFSEGFENGNTHWDCWTTINTTPTNGNYYHSWDRFGQCNYGNPSTHSATGSYSVMHGFGDDNHNDWLISPRLFLQPGRDNTKLTFKIYRAGSSNPTLWISTTDKSTSSFSEISGVSWGSTYGWETVTVNLNAYQGEAVYIAFKYSGSSSSAGLCWIDDFSVYEAWEVPDAIGVPYTENFDSDADDPEPGWLWYIIDNDHSGGKKCWKNFDNAMYHPYGQSGEYQEGWVFSPRIELPEGDYNYKLSFRAGNGATGGSNEAHTVWIALDQDYALPNPADYTQIWEEPNFSTSWVPYNYDLSDYAGHTISIGFKYEGTNAHNWWIDDFSVTQSITQYSILANSNNTEWGTVSGGGTYNSGATCSLSATPKEGYLFQSWKKNGSVVTTTPDYSFTVTEDASFTAYFGQIPVYTISTAVDPEGAGTVTGGGPFTEGTTITLKANNNPGYTFSRWHDNVTLNPRTITVTADATYTALFTRDQYHVTVTASPSEGGSVTGDGVYYYGETATLEASANDGFEFAGWSDGETANPRFETITGDATFTAVFNEIGTVFYTVTTIASPEEGGYITGGGPYEEGTIIALNAIPNPGYAFVRWSDGTTQNPRSVEVTGDMTFTAIFRHLMYTITVEPEPATGGTASGTGNYYYGDIVKLEAFPFSGYEFVGWSDGSSENPHMITVVGNATYTATFSQGAVTYYTVSAYVSPDGAGTVEGAGIFPAGATAELKVHANEGYSFSHWNDGNTNNPRVFTVNNNMSFTAYFTSNQYNITVNAEPAEGGTVTGGGYYAYGVSAYLEAIPNANYTFLQWSDGVKRNPRAVIVTQDASYTALFMKEGVTTYTLTVTSAQPELGTVIGSGTYPAGMAVEISAFPNANARFVKWNDGNTDNPRTVVVNSDMEFKAEFAAVAEYTIDVTSANPEMGSVSGGGTFTEGTMIEISALAFSGHQFVKWQDNNTDNPRTVKVTGNATYTAYFKSNDVVTYTLNLICNTDEGTVSGGGVYVAGTTVYVQAFPNNGYQFTKWTNVATGEESTNNPLEIVMNKDITLVAWFGTGVEENGLSNVLVYPNPAKESIRILGIEANSTVEIYNSLGELVKVVSVNPDQEIGIRDLSAGLYLIRCGNAALRFVKTL